MTQHRITETDKEIRSIRERAASNKLTSESLKMYALSDNGKIRKEALKHLSKQSWDSDYLTLLDSKFDNTFATVSGMFLDNMNPQSTLDVMKYLETANLDDKRIKSFMCQIVADKSSPMIIAAELSRMNTSPDMLTTLIGKREPQYYAAVIYQIASGVGEGLKIPQANSRFLMCYDFYDDAIFWKTARIIGSSVTQYELKSTLRSNPEKLSDRFVESVLKGLWGKSLFLDDTYKSPIRRTPVRFNNPSNNERPYHEALFDRDSLDRSYLLTESFNAGQVELISSYADMLFDKTRDRQSYLRNSSDEKTYSIPERMQHILAEYAKRDSRIFSALMRLTQVEWPSIKSSVIHEVLHTVDSSIIAEFFSEKERSYPNKSYCRSFVELAARCCEDNTAECPVWKEAYLYRYFLDNEQAARFDGISQILNDDFAPFRYEIASSVREMTPRDIELLEDYVVAKGVDSLNPEEVLTYQISKISK